MIPDVGRNAYVTPCIENDAVIRRLSIDDLGVVVAMELAHRSAPWSERVFRDELEAENRIYLAADEDGVVGFGGLMLIGDEAHVVNLLVSPETRRRGIGLSLMLALIDAALDAGARHLTLEVGSKNEAARALYAKLGLAPVGVRREYYGDDDALILWAHEIDSEKYQDRLEGLR
jgi:ribosomal-protein-alanine N-acetyltransferase